MLARYVRLGALASCLGLLAPALALAWPAPTEEERALDRAISEFSAAMRFSELINPTPASAAREERAFFEHRAGGRTYEPQFAYEPLSGRARAAAPALRRRAPPASPYGALLAESRDQLLAKFELLSHRGTPDFGARCAALYPRPDAEELWEARELVRRLGARPPERPLALSDREMAAALQAALREQKLDRWSVRLSDTMSANASVLPSSRVIKLKRGRRFPREDVVRLALHEVGVHARRAEQGHGLPLGVFRVGLEGYLETEEGMAAYHEASHDLTDGLRLFALRVLAVDWAGRLPFSRVFQRLVDLGVDEPLAYVLTVRVKRGLTDTGLPGCYTKDVCYLRGFLKVRALAARPGAWDDLLRFGKVAAEHLPALRRLEAQP